MLKQRASVMRALIMAAAGLFVSGALPVSPPALLIGSAAAEPSAETTDEAKAFDDAKALGTPEAWNAFLSHYSTGFHADLARAYLKKLTPPDPAPASTPAPAPAPEQPAYEQVCEGREGLRSRESKEPAKLRFINESGTTLVLQWIDFDGKLEERMTLAPGADLTQDTFITHPWIVAYQEGSCRQIFLPAPGVSTVHLRPQSELPKRVAPEPVKAKPKPKDYDDAPLKCAKNYKLVKGKCVLLQNCGANAYRSPEGDCYCTKNYAMQNGRCVWKTDKNGFEVAPWKKTGCSVWQKLCKQGSGKACASYEQTCQVN